MLCAQPVVGDDPFLNGRHARIFRDRRGRWTVEDVNSLNGVWVRIQRAALERSSEFQLGEQRFLFKLPDAAK